MGFSKFELAETEYIAELLELLDAAEARNDVAEIASLKDQIEFARAELRQAGSGVVTENMPSMQDLS